MGNKGNFDWMFLLWLVVGVIVFNLFKKGKKKVLLMFNFYY